MSERPVVQWPHRHGLVRRVLKVVIYGMPFPLYMGFHGLFSLLRALSSRGRSGVRPLGEQVSAAKTSRTLFVLGSGRSINRLTEAQWEVIRRHDSVGLNFWVIHDHVPTYLVFERSWRADRLGVMLELLRVRATDYQGSVIIMKGRAINGRQLPSELLSTTYSSRGYELPGRTATELGRALEWSRRLRIWRPGDLSAIPMKRGSISYLVMLGWFLGYDEIVLCGVDLNDPVYYYEERADEYRALGRPLPPSGQIGAVHRTLDPDVDPVTIDQVIREMDVRYLSPAGVRLYVGAASSALHPMLPAYEWEGDT